MTILERSKNFREWIQWLNELWLNNNIELSSRISAIQYRIKKYKEDCKND